MRLLCAFALVAAFGIGAGPAAADCAAPEASFTPPLSPKAAAPGETIRFEGEYWATECNDTVVCSNGCFRDACTEGEAPPRADSIAIEIRRAGGPPIMLVEGLDADEEYRFALDVPLPRDLEPGYYTVRVIDVDTGIEGYMDRDRLFVGDWQR
jgi:hypothetical protein